MGTDFRLGIQSYCFRKFKPLDSLIDCLKKVGLKYFELWPGHQPANDAPEALDAALAALARAGIQPDGYGAVRLDADEAKARRIFEFCKRAGLTALTVTEVAADAEKLADGLAEEYGVNIALHNHGRRHDLGRYDAIQALLDRTSQRFGVCLDTAWALDADEDPLAGVDRFGARLYGVHLKDFVFDGPAERPHRDVIIGTGGLDLPAFMKRLDGIGYRGFLSLEYEGNPEDPFAEVISCKDAVENAIAALV